MLSRFVEWENITTLVHRDAVRRGHPLPSIDSSQQRVIADWLHEMPGQVLHWPAAERVGQVMEEPVEPASPTSVGLKNVIPPQRAHFRCANTSCALFCHAIGDRRLRKELRMRQFSLARELARLIRPYLSEALWASGMGGVSSLATVGLLSLINQAMTRGLEPSEAMSFVALCVIMLGAEILSYRANSLVMQGAMADLRKSIVEKILTAPIDVLERMQSHRVIVTLNHDVQELTGFFRGIPFVFVSLLTALACVVYLFIVSPRLAMTAAIKVVIPMYVFRRMLASAFQLFYAEHEARDALQKEYDKLTLGSKELRLNRDRRVRFRRNRLFAKIEEVSELTRRNSSPAQRPSTPRPPSSQSAVCSPRNNIWKKGRKRLEHLSSVFFLFAVRLIQS